MWYNVINIVHKKAYINLFYLSIAYKKLYKYNNVCLNIGFISKL